MREKSQQKETETLCVLALVRKFQRMLLRCIKTLILIGFVFACDAPVETRYVDPSYVLAEGYEVFKVEGDPYVELGYYHEQLYKPLVDGDDCPVGFGLQGGTWTMPAVRTQGIGSPATIQCLLVTDGGETVGEVNAKQQFYLSPDGFLEIPFFPLPVNHAPPNETNDIEDLYGQSATLSCEVSDTDGNSNSSTLTVVIVEA